MSAIKLFRLTSGVAVELHGDATDLEKPLQTLIEANLETLLGIRFLASEYSTGKTHAGRIDSLGLMKTTARRSWNTSGGSARTSSIRGCSIWTG